MDRADRRTLARSAARIWQWYSIYTRFWRWAQKGIWEHIFKSLSDDLDFEYVLIDATHIRVHQPGTGAKGGLKIRPSASRAAA